MSGFVPVPDDYIPAVLAAVRDGRCVNCYQEFEGDGSYCPECDEDDDEMDGDADV